MDLKETIKHCQLGNKDEFKNLFMSIEKKAMSTAYLISGNRGIAEDILQEAYIKCFKEIKNLKNPEAFNIWFYRILVRTGWEMTKRHSAIIPVDPIDISRGAIEDKYNNIDFLIDRQDTQVRVKKAIDNLSYKLKETIVLFYFNDLSIEEISNIQGCMKSTVKSRLFYARGKLKKDININMGKNSVQYYRKRCSENE